MGKPGFSAASAENEEQVLSQCLAQLELLVQQQCRADEVAAVLVEPFLGEGGYLPPPKGFLPGLRKFCDAHGMLLIADEVQPAISRA
jgi:4-aminobutyrate aminotransferase